MTLLRCLIALLLLMPATAPAQEANDIEQIGPWRLMCFRGDKLYGHAFESCRAFATINAVDIYIDRNSKGIIGYLGGRCPKSSNVFRMSAASMAPTKKKRVAAFSKTIDQAFKSCGQPPAAAEPAPIAIMLQRSDGLSPEWVG